MPEEKQRKKRIRVEKLNEWIETLKSIERVNRDSEYFKQNAMACKEVHVIQRHLRPHGQLQYKKKIQREQNDSNM